jgi:AsmA-like protein
MATRRKIVLRLIVIVVCVIVLTILLVPVWFNLDRYRSQIISYFEQTTGKKAEIERVTLTFFPRPTVHIEGFAVKSPPLFPPSYILKVPHADTVLDFWALLHRNVVIRSVVLDQPQINLISDPDGPWNFENPETPNFKNLFPLGIIDKVTINHGQLIASILLPSDAQGPVFFEAQDISCELDRVDLAAIVNPTSSALKARATGKQLACVLLPSTRPMWTQNSGWSRVKFFSPTSKPTSTAEKPLATSPSVWRKALLPLKPTREFTELTRPVFWLPSTICVAYSPEIWTEILSLRGPSSTPPVHSRECEEPGT